MVGGLIYSIRNSSNKQSVFWPGADVFSFYSCTLQGCLSLALNTQTLCAPCCSSCTLAACSLICQITNEPALLSGPHSALG